MPGSPKTKNPGNFAVRWNRLDRGSATVPRPGSVAGTCRGIVSIRGARSYGEAIANRFAFEVGSRFGENRAGVRGQSC
jgi:hypothetical protein